MNQERQDRIDEEIIVDCYNDEEMMGSWYCYLEETLAFPFKAVCINERSISPLKQNEEVTVVEMGPYEECSFEMFVMIQWDRDKKLAIPLSQIRSLDKGSITEQAILDWHYWKN